MCGCAESKVIQNATLMEAVRVYRQWREAAECQWTTIQGVHVCISKGGIVAKGPKSMVGKHQGALKNSDEKHSALKKAASYLRKVVDKHDVELPSGSPRSHFARRPA